MCRQTIVHDFLHGAFGFDTDYAGELGVFAFLVAQRYTRWQRYAFYLALLINPLLTPTELFAIYRNARLGYELGGKAKCALEFPFEMYWDKSPTDIREMLAA